MPTIPRSARGSRVSRSVPGRKTGVLLRGQSNALAFNSERLFDYICRLHPSMKGQVEVKK
jgi:plastocyanin